MQPLAKQIEASELTLKKAFGILRSLPTHPPRYFLFNAMAGYLWRAVATGETILAVAKSRRAQGAEPLKRVLHECTLDTLFLIHHPAQDLLAAKCFLGAIMDSHELLVDYRQVLKSHPGEQLPAVTPELEEMFGGAIEQQATKLDAESVRYGGPDGLFMQALAMWNAKGSYWHWSGLNRSKMIGFLVDNGGLDQSSKRMVQSLTNIYNSSAHASPAWEHISLGNGESAPSFDNPRRSPTAALHQLVDTVDHFVMPLAVQVQRFLTGPGRGPFDSGRGESAATHK